jgi:hypothetical protein
VSNKELTAKEIRHYLFMAEQKLRKYTGVNKLVSQYRIKASYMLMWIRIMPIDKDILNGWKMPDRSTFDEFKKIGKIKRLSEKK